MSGRNGNTQEAPEEESSYTLDRLKNNEDSEELGISLLVELLDKNIEKRDDIKIMKKREGRGYGFYIRIPAEWAEKFGLKDLLKEKTSVEGKAIADFDNWALTIKIPKPPK